MHPYTHTCIHAHMRAYIHTNLQTYMHTCIHANIYKCIHAYRHTYPHTCKHTYIHTYILHTYIHTFIHTHINTYINTHWDRYLMHFRRFMMTKELKYCHARPFLLCRMIRSCVWHHSSKCVTWFIHVYGISLVNTYFLDEYVYHGWLDTCEMIYSYEWVLFHVYFLKLSCHS